MGKPALWNDIVELNAAVESLPPLHGAFIRIRSCLWVATRPGVRIGDLVVVRSPKTGKEGLVQLLSQRPTHFDDVKLWAWKATVVVRDPGYLEEPPKRAMLRWMRQLRSIQADAPVETFGAPGKTKRPRRR